MLEIFFKRPKVYWYKAIKQNSFQHRSQTMVSHIKVIWPNCSTKFSVISAGNCSCIIHHLKSCPLKGFQQNTEHVFTMQDITFHAHTVHTQIRGKQCALRAQPETFMELTEITPIQANYQVFKECPPPEPSSSEQQLCPSTPPDPPHTALNKHLDLFCLRDP